METGLQLKVLSDRLEKGRIEPVTTDLQGKWFCYPRNHNGSWFIGLIAVHILVEMCNMSKEIRNYACITQHNACKSEHMDSGQLFEYRVFPHHIMLRTQGRYIKLFILMMLLITCINKRPAKGVRWNFF